MIPEVLQGISPVGRYAVIGRDIVQVNTSIMGKPGRNVLYNKEYMSTDVPRKLAIYDPEEIPEGAGVPQTHETIEYVMSIPKKYGKRPMVTKELIEDAAWDVIARNTQLVMTAAREFEDKTIFDTLFTGALAANAITTTAADTLTLANIRRGIKNLIQYGWKADAIIVNPDFWESMMAYSWIAGGTAATETTSESWKTGVFNRGNMPPVFGVPVYMTALLENSTADKSRAMILAKKICGALTLKRDWTLEAVSDVITDQQGMVLTARFDVAVINPSAIVPITSL